MTLASLQFQIIYRILVGLQAREGYLQFIKGQFEGERRDLANKQMIETRALMAMASSWVDTFSKVPLPDTASETLKARAPRLLEMLATEYETMVGALKPIFMQGHVHTRDDIFEILATLLRQAMEDERMQKAMANLALERPDLGSLDLGRGFEVDSGFQMRAVKQVSTELIRSPMLKEWDLVLLISANRSLPSQLTHAVKKYRVLSEELSSGLAHYSELAIKNWNSNGIEDSRAPGWMAAGFTSEEASSWIGSGVTDAVAALEWSVSVSDAPAAKAWMEKEMGPRESRQWLAAGAADAVEAEKLKRLTLTVEGFVTWRSHGLTASEALYWSSAGYSKPEEAARNKASGFQPNLQAGRNIVRFDKPSEPKAAAPVPVETSRVQPVTDVGTSKGERVIALTLEGDNDAGESAVVVWGTELTGDKLRDEDFGKCVVMSGRNGKFYAIPKDTLWKTQDISAVPQPEPISDWQVKLDQFMQSRGFPLAKGAFYLLARGVQQSPQRQAKLWWGSEYSGPLPPWAASMDFMPSESFETRFKRKLDEWSEPAQDLNWVIGRHGKDHWIIARKESLEDTGSLRLSSHPSWREEFEDFSRILDLPLRRPGFAFGLVEMLESKVS